MKRLGIFAALLSASIAHAQNLVPNPSFEEYTLCPNALNQIARATGWSAYRGSPDYFNTCDSISFTGVPENWDGFQMPADGQAYAGVISFNGLGANTRELLGAHLLEPLVPGLLTHLSFKVSPTSNGFSENAQLTCNSMGMLLRMTSAPLGGELPNTAAVHMDNLSTDTAAWYIISGTYVPDSAYEYVVLGNFFSDSLVETTIINSNGNTPLAYFYIDDVSVSYDAGTQVLPNDESRSTSPRRVTATPNPFQQELRVQLGRSVTSVTRISLTDGLGRVSWFGELPPGQREIMISGSAFENGVYVLQVCDGIGRRAPIVLVHDSP